jgi:large subunit ribosomal protein L6
MSRVAKTPVIVSSSIEVIINGQEITVKGINGQLTRSINDAVKINYTKNVLTFSPRRGHSDGWCQAGTARSILNAMLIGVTDGFSKALSLTGVGYRATIQNDIVSLSLGFSHPVNYKLPKGISAQCPSQTEILLKGSDKQLVGQVAADLRNYRRPKPYKSKGIRYIDEVVRVKEAKKK